MKELVFVLVFVFLVSLIGSIEPVHASDIEYLLYVHLEVRNSQGYLVGIIESRASQYTQGQIPDHIFNSIIAKKEVIMLDGIKYEKVQFENSSKIKDLINSPDAQRYDPMFRYALCATSVQDELKCINLEHNGYWILMEEGDNVTVKWTVLRVID